MPKGHLVSEPRCHADTCPRYEEKTQYLIQLMIQSDNIQNQLVAAVEELNRLRRSDPNTSNRAKVTLTT